MIAKYLPEGKVRKKRSVARMVKRLLPAYPGGPNPRLMQQDDGYYIEYPDTNRKGNENGTDSCQNGESDSSATGLLP